MSDTKDEISANDQLSPDLRGVDAGDLGDWMYLRRRGAIKGDETLILAQDVRKAAQPFIDAAVAAERERWRELADHLRHCRECGETDVSRCSEGAAMWKRATGEDFED